MSTDTAGTGTPTPQVAVRRGVPTDDELAAIVAVLAAATRSAERARPAVDGRLVGGWKSYWAMVRTPFHAGREAWRHSYR